MRKAERERGRKLVWYWWYIYSLLFVTGGCTLENGLEVCPYNVRFSYTVCDGRGLNTGDYPIRQLRQFVYDERGILVGEYPTNQCQTGIGTLILPPGDYTLVTWGNASDTLCSMRNVTPGAHRLDEGEIQALHYPEAAYMEHVDMKTGETSEFRNTDLLYYGKIPFSVPRYGVADYQVGMMHAHARINLTIEWANGAPEAVRQARNPEMRISGVETGYLFTGSEVWGDYLFPQPHRQTESGVYRSKAVVGLEFKVSASFVTFRLRDESHPVVMLTEQGTPLMQEVDLNRFFTVAGIGLTHNLRQEFSLTIRIERDRTLIMETNISGWEEGGDVGTSY